MKLHYYSRYANFGDAMNGWLWQRLLPGCLDQDDRVRFSGIGTILHSGMPAAEHWVVFTSGVGYPPLPPGFGDQRWSVISVRGPLSAAALALPAHAAVTDGAILLAALPEYAPLPASERSGTVFVPHLAADLAGNWRAAAERAGVEYVSPLADSRTVIDRLRRAKLVLADAMHAAIVADAMRVPWVPLVTSPQINSFKWLDWTLSMKVPYAPVTLPPTNLVSRVKNAMLFMHGERHGFGPCDAAQALAHFRRGDTVKRQSWWPMARRFGQRLSRQVERQLEQPYLARWRRPADEALLERSAKALAAAAEGPGYLSDDRLFRDHLDGLQSRLDLVRAAASRARLGLMPAPAQSYAGVSPADLFTR